MATQSNVSTTINNKFLDKHKSWVMEGTSEIRRDNDNYATMIMGGTAWDRGAHLILNGMNSDRTGIDGGFELVAIKNNAERRLHGFPDGRLTWGDNDVVCVSQWYDSKGGFYRVYSDGMIEQGGYHDWASASGIVPLYKPYTNNRYNIQLTCFDHSNTNASMINVHHNIQPTTTQFNISVRDYSNGAWARPFYWRCIGY